MAGLPIKHSFPLLIALCYLIPPIHATLKAEATESRITLNDGEGDIAIKQPLCPTCCPRAEIGPQGASGIPGIPGPPGIPGNHGNNGNNGLPGLPGEKGGPGLPGLNGAKGDRGYPGPRGVQGEPGPPGNIALPASSQPRTPGAVPLTLSTKGQKGEPGKPGINGSNGLDGLDGLPGLPAALGQKGEPGIPGRVGPPGPPGLPGPVGLPGQSALTRKMSGGDDETNLQTYYSAFSAAQWMSQTARYGTVDIIFNYVFTNHGKDFNKDTGRFTCRVNGTYFFTFYVFAEERDRQPVVQLVKNDEFQVSPSKESMSNTIILDLVQGDQVWMKLYRGSYLPGNRGRQTTFSGHLLFSHSGEKLL